MLKNSASPISCEAHVIDSLRQWDLTLTETTDLITLMKKQKTKWTAEI
jgi:hypothetical protein